MHCSVPRSATKVAIMTSHDPALTPLAELRANVAVPFNQARAMPKSVYTSPEFADAELKQDRKSVV